MLAFNRYAGHRFPPEIISRAVWLYFRFPLTLYAILSKSISDLVHTVARRRALPVETGAIGRVTGRAVEFCWGFAEKLIFGGGRRSRQL
jgi:putative transposase